MKIAIQINGKVRDEIEVETDSKEEFIKELALAREVVQKYIN